jgi:hypothetical protein
MTHNLFHRIIYWLTFNLLVALFPLYFTAIYNYASGKGLSTGLAKSTEVLLYSAIVSLTTMADIFFDGGEKSRLLKVLFLVLLISALMSAALYGLMFSYLVKEDVETANVITYLDKEVIPSTDGWAADGRLAQPIKELAHKRTAIRSEIEEMDSRRARLWPLSRGLAVGIFFLGVVSQLCIGTGRRERS